MKQEIELKVNGETHKLWIKARRTLLEVLREELQLTGTKDGCNKEDCGFCTVIIDGKPILSCSTLAIEAQGREITTIEGVSEDGGRTLHPIQQAFVDEGATQCGFCTPGMIMSAKALLDANPNPTVEEIKEGISGNLCRCTGYITVVNAIQAAAGK